MMKMTSFTLASWLGASENDFDFEKMITSFGRKATKKIMFLMKEIENRYGTLEVQEELFRLEREKNHYP
jgi:hypothetical protein